MSPLSSCVAQVWSLEAALARAELDERVVAVAVLPRCCRPCTVDAREQLEDPRMSSWLARHAWLVEYDAARDARAARGWPHGPSAALSLVSADGNEVGWSSWEEEQDDRLRRFEEIVGKDDARFARRAQAFALGEDPSTRQERAQSFAERGDFARALDEYLWCFDHGVEVDPSYVGVRMSFLLRGIQELGKTYAPAAQALDDRMVRAEFAIESDPDNFDAWQEFTSIAFWRGAGAQVVGCAERLRHRRPLRVKIRLALLDEWLPLFLQSDRYAEVIWLCAGSTLDVATHWISAFENDEALVDQWLDDSCENDDAAGPFGVPPKQFRELRSHRRLTVASKVAGLYAAELALGRERSARMLLDRAVVFSREPAVYLEFARRADSVQRTELAAGVVREALAALPGADTAELTALLHRLEASWR